MPKSKTKTEKPADSTPPKLVRRRENKKSTFKLGRTIGAKREKLETANERQAARKKDKQKTSLRIISTIVGFLAFVIILVLPLITFFSQDNSSTPPESSRLDFAPTVEIIDEAGVGNLTSRMTRYIGRAEKDFRDLGYTPVKVIFPSNAIREVDFYLEGYPGFIKLTIDRDSAISVEDADRTLRYLAKQGITEFTYIDVRLDGRAYYK